MSPPVNKQVPSGSYYENTPPWLNPKDLKDICSTFDEVEKDQGSESADFERAIKASGHGKFNYFLLMAIFPAGWASVYGSTSMSYVLPSAECDLNLTLFDKGLLNSMPFAGMIVTAFLWGFLIDTHGRKRILITGYFFCFLLSLASSLAHASWLLILFKFLNGIVISGPYAALMSYLAEVHCEQQRTKIYMWLGVVFSLGNISLPCLAWLIMPHEWDFPIFNGLLHFKSWRLFLILCAVPELLAFIAISFFPESPRFLLSKGRNEEALNVFRRIYSINTGNDPITYPITKLSDEDFIKVPGPQNLYENLNDGWKQVRQLFFKPYVYRLILIGFIQFGGTIGSNTLRLWMPQLFAMIETYEATHPQNTSDSYPSICVMLDVTNLTTGNTTVPVDHINHVEQVCATVVLNSTVYLNSIVIALTGVIGYTLAGSLINCVGTKRLMMFCFLAAGFCCGGLFWVKDSNGILGTSSVFVALSSIGGAAVMNIIVDNFPTALRAMAISTTMMMGRIGAVTGNLLFPILFKFSCLGPFEMIGIACIICSILVTFVPNRKCELKESINASSGKV